MAILSRAIRNAHAMIRSAEWGDSSIPPNSQNGPMHPPGSSGGEAGALAIGTVLACVKALHDDTTVMSFQAYEGQKDGPHRPIKVQPRIVTAPFGDDLSPGAGMGQLVVSKAMRGDAYCYVLSVGNDGRPDQLLILHPDAVSPRRDRKTGRKYFQVGMDQFGPNEIIQMSGMMLPGAIQGIDLLTYQRLTFDLAWKVNAYADGFFGGGGSPAGVISVPGSGDRHKAREVKEAWESTHAGVANAHRPAVLFGAATWTPMTVTPENAQFLETRRFLREEICGLYSVPLQRIQAIIDNASQGGGKGLDAIDAGYVKHGLLPAVVGIEEAWNKLIPGGDHSWTKFNPDEFLRASAEIRAQIASSHRVGGIRTIDEIRGAEGWEPYPNGQGADPQTPLNSNSTTPAGGADNTPAPGSGGQ